MKIADMFKPKPREIPYTPEPPEPDDINAAVEKLGGPENADRVLQAVAELQAEGFFLSYVFNKIVKRSTKNERTKHKKR